MNSYQIGQVLYVVLRKETRVYPIQVSEIITKKTLEGDTVVYMVKGGTGVDQTLSIDQIDGEIFDAADDVRTTLIERATHSIERLIGQAVNKAHEWYPNGQEFASRASELAAIKKPVSMTAPKASRQPKPSKQPSPELAELPAEMQQEADNAVIELPDGTKAKVRSVKFPSALQG